MAAWRDLLLSPLGSVCRGHCWGHTWQPPHRDPADPQVRAARPAVTPLSAARAVPCPSVSIRVPPVAPSAAAEQRGLWRSCRGGPVPAVQRGSAAPSGAWRPARTKRSPCREGRPSQPANGIRLRLRVRAACGERITVGKEKPLGFWGCFTRDLVFWGRCYLAPCISADGDLSGFIQTHGSARSHERLLAKKDCPRYGQDIARQFCCGAIPNSHKVRCNMSEKFLW